MFETTCASVRDRQCCEVFWEVGPKSLGRLGKRAGPFGAVVSPSPLCPPPLPTSCSRVGGSESSATPDLGDSQPSCPSQGFSGKHLAVSSWCIYLCISGSLGREARGEDLTMSVLTAAQGSQVRHREGKGTSNVWPAPEPLVPTACSRARAAARATFWTRTTWPSPLLTTARPPGPSPPRRPGLSSRDPTVWPFLPSLR